MKDERSHSMSTLSELRTKASVIITPLFFKEHPILAAAVPRIPESNYKRPPDESESRVGHLRRIECASYKTAAASDTNCIGFSANSKGGAPAANGVSVVATFTQQ
ncbi:hypothetical protein EVAR_36519_1 [Eumeta japonica]|uniref:Uncharacterized protein n=1 Tax=Eumeta variegata TaxID=151549 RepID=A0A4C1XBE3_EUMVA|nr:hypothetical protein EVAR_36519_1 [Eumeta japonica]